MVNEKEEDRITIKIKSLYYEEKMENQKYLKTLQHPEPKVEIREVSKSYWQALLNCNKFYKIDEKDYSISEEKNEIIVLDPIIVESRFPIKSDRSIVYRKDVENIMIKLKNDIEEPFVWHTHNQWYKKHYCIRIDGDLFPVKMIFHKYVPFFNFTPFAARKWLHKLGFPTGDDERNITQITQSLSKNHKLKLK